MNRFAHALEIIANFLMQVVGLLLILTSGLTLDNNTSLLKFIAGFVILIYVNTRRPRAEINILNLEVDNKKD